MVEIRPRSKIGCVGICPNLPGVPNYMTLPYILELGFEFKPRTGYILRLKECPFLSFDLCRAFRHLWQKMFTLSTGKQSRAIMELLFIRY